MIYISVVSNNLQQNVYQNNTIVIAVVAQL